MNAHKKDEKENNEMNSSAPGVVDPAAFVAAGAAAPVRPATGKANTKRLTVDIPRILHDALSAARTPTRQEMRELTAQALAMHPIVRAELERLARDYPEMREDVVGVLAAYPARTDIPPEQ
jgi:hypothetical protein